MKIGFDKKKATVKVNDIVKSTKSFGQKATTNAKTSVAAIVEKSRNDSYERRLKKYNPLFPEKYQSDDFNLPNIIMIVDDAVRRDIDVCEGAIGWLGKEAGVEVLYLYDEAIEFSGITFVPTACCDTLYYVDCFDRNRFIRTDCIFTKAHEERLAELKHIAYSLGAKRCTIDIEEMSSSSQSHSKKMGTKEKYKGVSNEESYEHSVSIKGSSARSGHVEINCQGSDRPQAPTLKWFAHDDNIKRLIEMRCSDANSVKTESFKLSGATFATMSQKTACAIDGAIGKIASAKGYVSLNSQAEKEHQSVLYFKIEF